MTMTLLRHRLVVLVNGVPTRAFEADAQHGVNQPIGTASITLPLPLPSHLLGPGERVLNAPVTIQAGYDDGSLRTIFSGRIDGDRMTMDERSREATLSARGHATLLDFPEETDLIFDGPITLEAIVRSLCRWRRVPAFRIDRITYVDGVTDVLMGPNRQVNEGRVVIPRRTSPLAWLDRKLRLFGYRIFDTPAGELRVQRVSGLPTGAAAAAYVEGVNCFRLQRSRELAPMVTSWRVEGASYTDANGEPVKIVSIPDTVPANPLLTPPGYRGDRESDSDLTTVAMARDVRRRLEIDTGAPYVEASWETWGDPARQPGEAVLTESATFGSGGVRWLMSLRQTVTAADYTASMSAWAGAGTVLVSGSDSVTTVIGAGPYHVGDERLSHYAVPAPSGTTVRLTFDVPDDYTSIVLTGRGHGINSFLIDGANADSTVSKLEVWQGGEKVGDAELPVMPENLLQRLPYSNDAHWQAFRLPIPGKLTPGQAELRIVSGVDSTGGQDDFEVKALAVTLAGAGQPTLPRVGVT